MAPRVVIFAKVKPVIPNRPKARATTTVHIPLRIDCVELLGPPLPLGNASEKSRLEQVNTKTDHCSLFGWRVRNPRSSLTDLHWSPKAVGKLLMMWTWRLLKIVSMKLGKLLACNHGREDMKDSDSIRTSMNWLRDFIALKFYGN